MLAVTNKNGVSRPLRAELARALKCWRMSTAPIPTSDDPEIAQLNTRGFFVRENFLGEAASLATRAELEKLHKEGRLEPAGMAPLGDFVDRSLRGDEHLFLKSSAPELEHTMPAFEALHEKLRDAGLKLVDFTEFQAAVYPGNGARYVRHIDYTPLSFYKREVTALLYLNPGWVPEHGGSVRVFTGKDEYTDVEPKLDRLLVFRSRDIAHEVLPAHAPRYALTIWYHTR